MLILYIYILYFIYNIIPHMIIYVKKDTNYNKLNKKYTNSPGS